MNQLRMGITRRPGAGVYSFATGFALTMLAAFYGVLALQTHVVTDVIPSTPGLLAISGTSAGMALCFVGLRKTLTATSHGRHPMSRPLAASGILAAVVAGWFLIVLAMRLLSIDAVLTAVPV
jgi:hypothetical protein